MNGGKLGSGAKYMQTGNNIYQFNRDDAFRFANEIGHKAFQRGNELVFVKCPYCGYVSDKKFKFSINLETGQFHCFRGSCNVSGNMIRLSHDFGFRLSEEVDRYINRGNYNGRFKKFRDSHKVFESKDSAVEYLKSRGISEKITRKYEITAMPERDNVLVFPFKDEEGALTFIKYRNTEFVKGQTEGSKEWSEKDCMPILFGMNHCEGFGRLVITEGQIDSLSVAESGITNAVSVPNGKNAFTWVPHCWNWLNNFQEIIVFGDLENGTVTLAETISKRFPKQTKIVRPEDYQGYKDANDILRNIGADAIRKAVENAVSVQKSKLVNMSTVEFVDIEHVETIKTNIKEFDKILTGGFKVGSLVILSGERGNGKSTCASYFIVEALNQGYGAFIYSGELPKHFVRNWIDRQIVGSNPLTNAQINRAGDWYDNKLFIYDNSIVIDDDTESDNETESLISTMEIAIQQKGVKFLVLDNLMTAMDDVSTADVLYQTQRAFVRRLAKMAKRFDVVIVLVAHPKKKNNYEFTNDSVSGSSVITDAADIVMSYDKITDNHDPDHENPDVRNLYVTKNRLTGNCGKIKVWFDKDSKRITGKDKNFEREYLSENGFKQVDMEGEIPFT